MKKENNQMELSELEKIFFENFTKKQHNNNDYLLRLLLVIGSLIVAYGYLILKIDEANFNVTVIFFMLIVVEIFLSIYFKIIYDEGFAFRRDQIVVYRILKRHGLVSVSEENDKNNVYTFPYYYNVLKKFNYKDGKLKTKKCGMRFLMPAFHNTLAGAILSLQILLCVSFLITNCDMWLWVIALFILIIILAYITYKRKDQCLRNLYKDEFEHNNSLISDCPKKG